MNKDIILALNKTSMKIYMSIKKIHMWEKDIQMVVLMQKT